MYRLVVELDYENRKFIRFALDKNKTYGTVEDAIDAAENYFDLGMSKIRIAHIEDRNALSERWIVFDNVVNESFA